MMRTLVTAVLAISSGLVSHAVAAEPAPRPNIVWLTSEDHGPHLGCYGDTFASSPHVDALAARGLRYTRVWSNAPVCAPARTTLISGLYPTATGSEHMRSLLPYPSGKQMFPELLRAAGYYCTNNSKEDYNLAHSGRVWDESSNRAHWRNRAGDQPFFAVFNSTRSHESQIRRRPHTAVHDPAGVHVPAYHPDTPEVRQDWAQYYDCVSDADADAGARIQELAEAGLLESTIVFYFADHGSGMPRNKRSPCDSGLHVPLILYIPEAFAHLRRADYVAGGHSDRFVSFVDFAPTVLSLAGIDPPNYLHGHAFLGPFAAPPQPYAHGFRGRMDERHDLARSVTDGRYVYVRNYLPHKPFGPQLSYMFQTPTTQVWWRRHLGGTLTPEQDYFWNPKPHEELYDLTSDPEEVHNLAEDAAAQSILAQLRQVQREQALAIRDVGFLPEGELHTRFEGHNPMDLSRDEVHYPCERVLKAAENASDRWCDVALSIGALQDADSAVRYWGALGILIRGEAGLVAGRAAVTAALEDPSPHVRVVAGEILGRYGTAAEKGRAQQALYELADWSRQDVFAARAALEALTELGDLPVELQAALQKLPRKGRAPDPRYVDYVGRLIHALR
jgi:uncharacterized sulfatase